MADQPQQGGQRQGGQGGGPGGQKPYDAPRRDQGGQPMQPGQKPAGPEQHRQGQK